MKFFVGVVNALFTLLYFRVSAAYLQQSGYSVKKTIKAYYKSGAVGTAALIIISLVFAVSNYFLCAADLTPVLYVSYFGALSVLSGYFLRKKLRVSLKFTKRLSRITALFAIINILLNISAAFIKNYAVFYSVLALQPAVSLITLCLSATILIPYEKYKYFQYTKKCKAKLESNPNLIRIGITGSYGKTSVKNILKTVLSVKYRVLATPESYNTPFGICKTVNELTDSDEIFIAEMGARKKGDIAELSRLVSPSIGIITGITNQHLETFGSINNIIDTKYELILNLPENGFAVFSADNPYTVEMYDKCKIGKAIAGIKGAVKAENIKITENGTEFVLNSGGISAVIRTKLLGRHNVTNICLAAAVAEKLGLTAAQISFGASLITPVPHRLELTKSERGVYILDDGYNSNEEGFYAAAEVLKGIGNRKIIVTPGIVELGNKQYEINKRAAEKASGCADCAVIVGKTNRAALAEGFAAGGMGKENIITAENITEVKNILKDILKEGDSVLFENDLPDIY